MNALSRLRGCAVAPEPSIFAYTHAKSSSGVRCWILGLISFDKFYTICEQTVKALTRLRERAVAPEPSLFAYAHAVI